MKKRFLAILTAAMLLMTCAALGEAAPAGVSGDFTGTAQGFGGEVSVTVTLTDGAITAVTAEGAGFGTDTNLVTLITREDETALPLMSKREVAGRIWDAAMTLFKG